MGQLKDRLIEEIKLRGFSKRTEEVYVSVAEKFIIFTAISPVNLTLDHVRKYKLHLINSKFAPRTINQQISAIKFFFILVLKKRWDNYQFRSIKVPRKLPVILSKREIVTFLNSTDNLAHQTIFMTMYSCGLRRSEVVKLKTKDVDSKRMLLNIKDSKNGKDRNVILSEQLLRKLRHYWEEDPKDKRQWLFPSTVPDKHYGPNNLNVLFKKILKESSINKKVSCHSLRHSWATHMLEDGINLRYLQVLLGHSSILSTAIYTHLVDFRKVKVKSPLDSIASEIKQGGTNGN